MKSISKKYLALLLALVLAISIVPVGSALAADSVDIQSTFTDPVFREAIAATYDEDGNGELSADERDVSLISVSGLIDTEVEEIKDLKGIECFTSLRILRCGGIGLESLDVSALPQLTSLTCQGNRLTSLDLSNNTNLVTINCSDNEISSLTLPTTNVIKTLYCYANNLTELSTTYLKSITNLRCDQNELSSLYINAKTLVEFNCSQNHLTFLDLSQTSLTDVTDYMIGHQTITLTAQLENGRIFIPFMNNGLYDQNYRGCNLDEENGSGMNEYYTGFYANEVWEFEDGFKYECYPLLAGSENMSVDVTVERDFHQVDFYTDDSLSQRISYSFVEDGAGVTPPAIPQLPQCKTFASWSEELSSVTTDIKAYALYDDAHSYRAVSLAADGDTVNIRCANCDDAYTVSFISMINTTPADEVFDSAVDVNGDSFINAKDYAILLKLS